MENKILIAVERFEELIRTERNYVLLFKAVYNEEASRLNYDDTSLYFEPNTEVLKLLHPKDYTNIFEKLKTAKEQNNV